MRQKWEPNIDLAKNTGRNRTERRLWLSYRHESNRKELESGWEEKKRELKFDSKAKKSQPSKPKNNLKSDLAQALTIELHRYIEGREKNTATYTTPLKLGRVLGFFGLAHPGDVKIKAAEKLIQLLTSEKIADSDKLTPRELSALKHGDLGEIVNNFIYATVVTEAIQRIPATECKFS